MYTLPKNERFNQEVLSKYHIYNSVFITLPFDSIDNTGVLLPLFTDVCDTGFKKQETPKEIVNFFSQKYLQNTSESENIDLMFRFIQYIERQIVLFDAIEDAAFPIVNNMEGRGTLRDINEKSEAKHMEAELIDFLENFNIRTVLTAHPTQFYPGAVLGIINDLTEAIRKNNLLEIKQLLAGSVDEIPVEEMPAYLFAQHYADRRGYPTEESWDRIVALYGEDKAKGILGAIRAIMVGNAHGIAFSAFLSRLKGKAVKKSSLLYEITMMLSIIVYLPLTLIHALIDGLFKKPVISF